MPSRLKTVMGAAISASTALAVPATAAVVPPVTDGLIVHLDESNVTLDSGLVAIWNDQSGQMNHAVQSSATNRPQLISGATPAGTAAIRFTAANSHYLDVASNAGSFDTSALTWFVVFRPEVSPDNARMLSGAYSDIDPDPGVDRYHSQAWASITHLNPTSGTGYRTLTRTAGGGFLAASTGAGELNTTDFYIGASFVDTSTDEYAARVTLPDGSTLSSSIGSDATLQFIGHQATRIAVQSGTSNLNPTGHWSGDIAAILIYNRRLSDAEIAAVSSELYSVYIPEPSSLGLLAVAALCLARTTRSRQRAV